MAADCMIPFRDTVGSAAFEFYIWRTDCYSFVSLFMLQADRVAEEKGCIIA
jgi:hypothetical protein